MMESSLDLLIQDIHNSLKPKEAADLFQAKTLKSAATKVHGQYSGLDSIWNKLDEQAQDPEPSKPQRRKTSMDQIWKKLDF